MPRGAVIILSREALGTDLWITAPMIGGMMTSTVLTLVVIPVLYYLWRRREVTM